MQQRHPLQDVVLNRLGTTFGRENHGEQPCRCVEGTFSKSLHTALALRARNRQHDYTGGTTPT